MRRPRGPFFRKEKSMGLFDEVVSMAGSALGQQAEHAGALSAILGYVNSPQVGGITGLEKMFQQGGLGEVFKSWVSTGQNMPDFGRRFAERLAQRRAAGGCTKSGHRSQSASRYDDHSLAAPNRQTHSEWTNSGCGLVAVHAEGFSRWPNVVGKGTERCFARFFPNASERSLRRGRPSGRSATGDT